MLGATLIRDQVVQMGQPAQKRLLAPFGVMAAFHREQLPLDGVMGLIQQRAGDGHLRVGEHRIPPRLLLLHPAPHPRAIGWPSRGGDVVRKVAPLNLSRFVARQYWRKRRVTLHRLRVHGVENGAFSCGASRFLRINFNHLPILINGATEV